METFIINSTDRCSDKLIRATELLKSDYQDSSPQLAAICVPIRHEGRRVKQLDGNGENGHRDDAIAAVVVIRRVATGKLHSGAVKESNNRIAASCYKVCMNGIDSFGTVGIDELSSKMSSIAAVINKPLAWHLGTVEEISDAFAEIFPGGKPRFL